MRSQRFFLAVCCIFFFVTAPADGAVRITNFNKNGDPAPIFWTNAAQGIPYVYHTAGSRTLSPEAVAGAINAAFKTWENVATAYIKFKHNGGTANATVTGDGVNKIVFDATGSNFDFPQGSGVIAMTVIRDDNLTGAIQDADLVFNERDFVFVTGTIQRSNEIDLQGVATHEIGHFLGLEHSPIQATIEEVPTMNPFGGGLLSKEERTLEYDDIAGVSMIYPTQEFLSSTGSIAGRVIRPDGQPVFGAHVVALDPVGGKPLVSGLSGYLMGRLGSGEYLLPGLPAGNYIISIEPLAGSVTEENFGGIFQSLDTDFEPEYYENTDDMGLAETISVAGGANQAGYDFVTGFFAPGFPEIIAGSPLANTPDTRGPYPLRISVYDDSPLSEIVLNYRVNGGSLSSVPLANDGDSYYAEIPGQPEGTRIEYMFEAENALGKRSRWPSGNTFLSFDVIHLSGAPIIYAAMRSNDLILVLDSESREEIARIPVGRDPLDLVISHDQKRLYVVNNADGTVTIIDTGTNRILETVPTGDGALSALISPDDRRVYVNNSIRGTISVIDAATNKIILTLPLNDAEAEASYLGFAISADGGTLYAADINNSRLTALSAQTGAIIKTVDTVAEPRWIAVSPDGSRLYVTSFSDPEIGILDAASLNSLGTIDISPAEAGFALALSADGGTGYLADHAGGNVAVIDINQRKVLKVMSTGGINPRNVAVSPDGKRVFISNQDSDNMMVLNAETLEQDELLGVLDGPRGVVLGDLTSVVTDIDEGTGAPSLPADFAIHQNYPNPFNPATNIRFEISRPSRVRIAVFNTLGQRVRTLIDADFDTGSHLLAWDGRNQAGQETASGVYFAVMQAGEEFRRTIKMLLVR